MFTRNITICAVYLIVVFIGGLMGNNEQNASAAGLVAAIAYAMEVIISKIEKRN